MAKKKQEESKTPEEALELAIASIRKEFGAGAAVTGKTDFPQIERIPTGSIGLDQILLGGYAKGRIIEVYGPESSGKTTLTLHAIAECQKLGGKAAFIDAEHAFDAAYATQLGVNVQDIVFSQPDCGEDAMNIVETFIRSKAVDLIVVDSVAALVPRAEIEKQVGDSVMGKHAQMMSQTCRKIAGITQKSGTTVIFINQIRHKIGVMFGSPETVTGGNALKFYSSQRLEIRRGAIIKDGEHPIGITSRVKIAKSKVSPPFRQVEFDIIFGKGIDWAADLLNVSVERGLIEKSGAWYSYNGEKIGQGAANTAQWIRDHQDEANKLRAGIFTFQ